MSTFVIVNPTSRSGEAGRRLPELKRLFVEHVREPVHWLVTTGEGDGARLGREAAASGATRIAVAGGDGTVSEVVSGLFEAKALHRVQVAMLPCGSGGDLARLLRLGRDLKPAVARLTHGRTRLLDVGLLTHRDGEDAPRTRCFLNITSFGMSGEAMLWMAEQGRKGKRGALSYVESGVRGLWTYRSPRVRVRIDERVVHDDRLLLGVVANGQYFGAGMHVTPHALLDDALYDVVLAEHMSKLSALRLFPKLVLGRHLGSPHVRVLRGRVVELESDADIWLESDGEPVGRLPARLELLPRALTLCGLP